MQVVIVFRAEPFDHPTRDCSGRSGLAAELEADSGGLPQTGAGVRSCRWCRAFDQPDGGQCAQMPRTVGGGFAHHVRALAGGPWAGRQQMTQQGEPGRHGLVAEIGLRGLISVQLYASGTTLGALNLFSTEPQNFSSDDVEKARAVATIVSIELARSRHDAHLWKAVDARHRVGQAQGILMHQFRFGSDEAWALLLRLSQQGNTKLFVIADRIIAAGELPRKLAAPDE